MSPLERRILHEPKQILLFQVFQVGRNILEIPGYRLWAGSYRCQPDVFMYPKLHLEA